MLTKGITIMARGMKKAGMKKRNANGKNGVNRTGTTRKSTIGMRKMKKKKR